MFGVPRVAPTVNTGPLKAGVEHATRGGESMDARDRVPPEELTSFVSGMEFGLLTLQGRLRRMEDPTVADLLAAIEDVRQRGRQVSAASESQSTPAQPRR